MRQSCRWRQTVTRRIMSISDDFGKRSWDAYVKRVINSYSRFVAHNPEVEAEYHRRMLELGESSSLAVFLSKIAVMERHASGRDTLDKLEGLGDEGPRYSVA